ncbi:MAG TPA: hypothetical protein VHZ51_07560 [Ktedonobacteraceae bacterium]|jgi:hypothetical protein|nr:hypothetical protein [Ktedonobacteraceae bacterium]
MQKQQPTRQSSGSKAIALDLREKIARYRFSILLSILSGTALALVLQIIFAH